MEHFAKAVLLLAPAMASENATKAIEKIKHHLPSWTVAGGSCVIMLLCLVCAVPVCNCLRILMKCDSLQAAQIHVCPTSSPYRPCGYDRAHVIKGLVPRLLGDAITVLLQPLLGIAIALLSAGATGWVGVPWWTPFVVAAPFIVRSMRVDAYYVRILDGQEMSAEQNHTSEATAEERTIEASVGSLLASDVHGLCTSPVVFPPPFTTSKIESFDATSDGIAIVAVSLMQADPIRQARFDLGWSSTPFIAPGIIGMGLPCLMGASLATASVVQLGSCFFDDVDGEQNAAVRADLAGLGATLRRLTPDDEARERVSAFVNIGRVVYEAGFQVACQGTAVMVDGHGLLGQPVLLLSFVLSGVTGFLKLASLGKILIQGMRKYREGTEPLIAIVGPGFLFLLGTFLLVWGIGRVIRAEFCASKMWGVFSGCVEMPESLMKFPATH